MSFEPEPSLLLVELRRYAEVLTNSGPEALAELWDTAALGLPEDLVAEFVAARFLDQIDEIAPFQRVPHPNLQVTRSPLLATLHRHRNELRAGGVDALFRLWNLELRKLSTPKIAGEVARRLLSEEYAEYRKSDDPTAVARDRVYHIISRFHSSLIQTAVGDLHRNWAAELVRFERLAQVIEIVADRLSQPAYAGYLLPGASMPRTGEDALRAALRRYPEIIPAGQVEPTFQAWRPLFATHAPARVAGLVAEKLGASN